MYICRPSSSAEELLRVGCRGYCGLLMQLLQIRLGLDLVSRWRLCRAPSFEHVGARQNEPEPCRFKEVVSGCYSLVAVAAFYGRREVPGGVELLVR